MNDKQRILKRIYIISIFVLFLALVILFIYWLVSPKETCFDGIKNQNEEDVDCGGRCEACKILEYENLNVTKKGVTESGREGEIDVFVKVKNPNNHLGIKDIKYKLVILGDSDEILGTYYGNSFFLPQEEKTLIESNLVIEKDRIREITWEAEKIEWVEFNSSFENPNFKIINKNLNFEFSGSFASGILVNESPYDFSVIGIKIILKNQADEILFTNTTEMRTVKSGEKREFKAIWPGKLPDAVVKMDVEAEVNIFDPQSFFRQYYESQKFQEVAPLSE